MKSKYELTISSNYVKSWTYLEGVREFFQNAIDENNKNSDHCMTYGYADQINTLYIRNANCKLDVNTLLLGETSKSDGQSIGSFGEGYKIGILVLLREGKKITIHNAEDLWSTRLVNSRKYKSIIPVIEVQKNYDKSCQDLVVEIEGITKDELNKIIENTMYLKNEYGKINKIHTDYGDLLTDESEKGRIYVGGLFICEDFELAYGYDINPKNVELNRDRNMISQFGLIWNTSRIIANAMENDPDKLYKVLDIKDTEYIDNFIKSNSKNKLIEYFQEKYGDKIPVTTQEEYNYFKNRGMKPTIVSKSIKSIIGSSSDYSRYYTEYQKTRTIYEEITSILNNLENYINNDGLDEYNKLYDLIEKYEDELKEIEIKEE